MKKTSAAGLGLAAAVAAIHYTCAWELFLPPGRRALIALKNRTAIPEASAYDPSVTLGALIRPGHDVTRWSASRAARLEGYVVAVHEAGIELANCLSLSRRDVHVELALRPDAPPRERVVLEVTPRMQDWARTQGLDWSAASVRQQLLGRRARLAGWLFYDSAHARESENLSPGDPGNWRATAWEVHPVTAFDVLDRPASRE